MRRARQSHPSPYTPLFRSPTRFNFLSVGQWLPQVPGEDRKGIGLLLATFCKAFKGNAEVGLILKTFCTNNSSPDRFVTERRVRAIRGDNPLPYVHLLHGDMSDIELAQLYTHPDVKAFVSCTSGESWGRTAAEAIACDLPLLITGWSGHMDYICPEYTTLFDYQLHTIPRSVCVRGIYEPTMQWACPDPEDIARKLKRCYNGYTTAVAWAKQQGKIFRATWNKNVTDTQLIAAVDSVVAAPSSVLSDVSPASTLLETSRC